MGCRHSKERDVDFTELDRRRSELGFSESKKAGRSGKYDREEGNGKPSIISGLTGGTSEMMTTWAKQAKPIMDNMILTDATPKLSKQVVATAAVVMGTKFAHRQGAHHLKNVFVPPLEDVSSFTAPKYPKSHEEKKLIREGLKNNFVFAACTERELRTIVDAFEEFIFQCNEKIIIQGDVGDYFYVLKSGSVRFELHGKLVGNASETGTTFGELALLYSSPRAASVIAESQVTLYRVDQKTFRYIMQSQTMETEKAKKELLQGVTFLHFLDPSDIDKLVHTMIPRVFEEGECIVRKNKNEVNDTLYVIQEGKVRVTEVPACSNKNENQELGPGDHFGENCLLHKEGCVNSATVIGVTKGLALSIDKETFEKVVGDITVLAIQAEYREILFDIPILKDTKLSKPTIASLASFIVEKTYPPNTIIMKEGEKTSASIYIIRSGEVVIQNKSESFVEKNIKPGGYFGENMLKIDHGGIKKTTDYDADFTVMTLADPIVVGILAIESCRNVIDTTVLGQKLANVSTKCKTPTAVHDLQRHTILGAGTFGQVWLVSDVDPHGERHPYALKIQSKYELIKSHQAKGVVQEKKIMEELHHPFLTNLVATYQDKNFIYMLLEIVQGGELYSIMHSTSRDGIDEKNVSFYASGILEGLSHMHRSHFLYRDLKPENVMIDKEGYPVIIDFGFAKFVKGKTYTFCGTPLYLAPEVILNRGHDKGADHWSYGCLVYEMIDGRTPFYNEGMDQVQLFRCICKGKFEFPPEGVMSQEVRDLLQRLFVLNPAQRIGSLADGINQIYTHPWYKEINFGKLRQKELDAPWVPEIKDILDTANFETWDHLKDKTQNKERSISTDHQKIFKTF